MTLNEQGLRLLQVLVTSVQLRDDSVSQDVLQKDMTASVPLLDGCGLRYLLTRFS